MANKQDSSGGKQLKRLSVNRKDISRRYKKVEGATLKHARRFVFRRLDNFKVARRHVALWCLLVGIIIGASGLQFFWYQEGYRTSASDNGGTYAEAVQGPLDTLNPLFATTSAEESASELVFSRLLQYDRDGQINYDLADSMKVSDDQKTYTLTIRPDARWHDGLYVRAKDVVFTVNLVKNSAVHSNIVGWDSINVKEVDSRTVAFELPSVYAPFPNAIERLPILPEHILRDVEPSELRESGFSTKPVGSGPFAVRAVQSVNDDRKVVHLTKNEDYYLGPAKLDRFQLYVYESMDSIRRAFLTGEVNAATGFSVVDSLTIDSDRYSVERYPVNTGVYALFNTTSPALKDIKVRRALQVGTDMEKVRGALAEGVTPLHLPFISSQVDGTPGAPKLDIKKANDLLDDAGWKLSGETRVKGGEQLRLSVVTTKNNDFEKILDELASQWRKLGVAVTTRIVDPSDPLQNVAQDILQPRQYDVLLYPLTIGGDPDVYAYWHSSQASNGLNFSNYSNTISDDALFSARTRLEPDLRNAKYVTFARQWLNDAPALGLYQLTAQYVHTKGVRAASDDIEFVSAASRYSDVMYWSVGSRLVYKTP